MGAREERLAENEARFREVNERVAEVATLYIETETHRAVDFTCDVVVDGLGEDLEALSSRLRELLDQDRWKPRRVRRLKRPRQQAVWLEVCDPT